MRKELECNEEVLDIDIIVIRGRAFLDLGGNCCLIQRRLLLLGLF